MPESKLQALELRIPELVTTWQKMVLTTLKKEIQRLVRLYLAAPLTNLMIIGS
jgi:hypothetical protein